MLVTLAGLRHAARIVKLCGSAVDNYSVPRRVRRLTAALASVAALAVLPASAHANHPSITGFSTGLTVANAPADITEGPDGNLWFTSRGILPGVGRITPTGSITEYPVALLNTPGDITTGPDGALWFTQRGLSDAIVRVDPADGTMEEHPLPGGMNPTAITLGSDGNLWFIASGTKKLVRMKPDGSHDEFNAGLSGSDTLNDITSGPDGQLWVTIEADGDNRIESFSPADPDDPCFWSSGLSGAPNKIVAASDGKLYFTLSDDPGAIGRIKTDGTIREFSAGLTPDSRPVGIAEGGDNALWFTGAAHPGRIGRMATPSHAFSELVGGTAGLDLLADADPNGITRGPDGNVWFTESGLDGRISRVSVPPAADLELNQGQLKATVTANTQETTFRVEYGPDKGQYDQQSGSLTVPASQGAVPVAEVVPLTLEPRSHYHARLVATNGSGDGVSADLSLWTDENGKLLGYQPTLPAQSPPLIAPTSDAKPGSGGNPSPGAGTSAPVVTAPIAPPVLGKAVVVKPLTGTVRVKAPGARSFTPLAAGANLPVGTMVDTRAGKIVLQSARNKRGRTQNGTFWGGVFQIRQKRSGKGMTSLVLRGGSFARCGNRAGVSVLAREAKGKRRVVRRLWGKDRHARFRTHGRDSVATVRGTRWVTTDRCIGTVTRVTEGKVLVRDLRKKRSVLVRAGDAYLARHRSR